MKDSKEKEHRISNLKDMIDNMNNEEEIEEDIEDEIDEVEEDDELINYLKENETKEELEIDDEFIYHPDKDNLYAVNLEDENKINDDFIIKTEFNEKELDIDEDLDNEPAETDDFETEFSENFDNILNAKIGQKPLLAIISLIIGIIFIILSIVTFNSGTDRIIDNVVSGENRFIMVIFLIIGILLTIYGIYKISGIKNPFDNIATSINNIEKENKKEVLNKADEELEQIIPKSNIPLDKESYKIGEFNMDEIRETLKKPSPAKKKQEKPEENIDEKIEEVDYEQAKLDNESIDEIFAEVEEIDIDKKEE